MSQPPHPPQPGPAWPTPPPRRQRHVGRNIGISLAAVIVLLAATVGISLLVMGKNPVSSVAAAVKPTPPTCRQQYETWKSGSASLVAKMKAALRHVQAASQDEDLLKMNSGLKAAGRASGVLRRSYPVPHCADPAGYYGRFLGRIVASGDNARSESGLAGLLLAEAPLKTVLPIEKKLNTELNRTVGKNR